MEVYCVFRRQDLSVFHYEFLLITVFDSPDKAVKFMASQPDPTEYRMEPFYVK